MGISVVSQATCIASSGVFSTLSFSSSFGAQADVVYCFGGSFNASTALGTIGPSSNSASVGSSFTQLVASSTVSGGPLFGIWRRIAGIPSPSSSRIGFSSAFTTSASAYGAIILRGVSSTAPESITTVFTSGAGTTPQSPSVTTTVPNCMLLSIVGTMNDSSGMTGPTGFSNVTVQTTTNNATANFTVGIATLITATVGSTAPGAWTSTVSTSWFAATVVVNPYSSTAASNPNWPEPIALQLLPLTAM